MPYLRPDERNVECELTGQLLLPGHLHLTQTSRVLKLEKILSIKYSYSRWSTVVN